MYILAATTKPDTIMAGGHYRIKMTPDGNQVKSMEPLSGSCLELTTPPAYATAVFLTNLTGYNTPQEIHVYLNYLIDKDIYLFAGSHNWKISSGKITPIN
ncbi:MAG: hypothetical protein JW860_01645 [Sedimentisphaerales bacterium]|nr:hypothetical protein [Sedimentisphaerales bacterium]